MPPVRKKPASKSRTVDDSAVQSLVRREQAELEEVRVKISSAASTGGTIDFVGYLALEYLKDGVPDLEGEEPSLSRLARKSQVLKRILDFVETSRQLLKQNRPVRTAFITGGLALTLADGRYLLVGPDQDAPSELSSAGSVPITGRQGSTGRSRERSTIGTTNAPQVAARKPGHSR